MAYEYKVVPFLGQSRGSLSAADIASQLEHAIRQNAVGGWEFFLLSDVNVEIQPGCVAGLLGARVQYVRFDQLIFRSEIQRSDTSSVTFDNQTTVGRSVRADRRKDVDTSQRSITNAQPIPAGDDEPWLSPFCYHCGAEVSVGAKNCSACGLAL